MFILTGDIQERARIARIDRCRLTRTRGSQGLHVDLNQLFDRLNNLYFASTVTKPSLSWSAKKARHGKRSAGTSTAQKIAASAGAKTKDSRIKTQTERDQAPTREGRRDLSVARFTAVRELIASLQLSRTGSCQLPLHRTISARRMRPYTRRFRFLRYGCIWRRPF